MTAEPMPPCGPTARMVLTTMQARRLQNRRVLRKMRKRWPALFTLPKVPLAIGIYEQLCAALPSTVSRRRLGAVLHHWTDRADYHIAVAAGLPRTNLDGTDTGPPSLVDQERALDRLFEKVVERQPKDATHA